MEWLIGLLPVVLIALACSIAMFFMMRGMHGSRSGHEGHDTAGRDRHNAAELQELRREVAALRRQVDARAGAAAVEKAGGRT